MEINIDNKTKDFFDFSEDILSDIISEGYKNQDILKEFKHRKNKLYTAIKSIDQVNNFNSMTKEEFKKAINL